MIMSQQLKNIIFLYYLYFAFVSICINHSQILNPIFGLDLHLETCILVILLFYVPLGFVFLCIRVFFPYYFMESLTCMFHILHYKNGIVIVCVFRCILNALENTILR